MLVSQGTCPQAYQTSQEDSTARPPHVAAGTSDTTMWVGRSHVSGVLGQSDG